MSTWRKNKEMGFFRQALQMFRRDESTTLVEPIPFQQDSLKKIYSRPSSLTPPSETHSRTKSTNNMGPAKCPFMPAHVLKHPSTEDYPPRPELVEPPPTSEFPGDNYMDYLRIDDLLSLQCRLTTDKSAHDEHLFILTHQVFELWFKQILYELSSLREIFQRESICERYQHIILQRLVRVNHIFRIMVQQFEVLETMGCVGFASFRSLFKGGASGFQSTQFRILESLLGIKEEQRTCTFMKSYNSRLKQEQRNTIEKSHMIGDDLFTLVDRWLSRTPALRLFIPTYKTAIENTIEVLRNSDETDPERREALEKEAEDMEERFATLFDSTKFSESSKGQAGRKLSYEGFAGALMITCYASEPRFTVPYEIIRNLLDLDTFFTKWRFAHVMMVKRIIGGKPGTGGSGGYTYLRSTVSDRYMPFKDLFEVSTFVIPPQLMPELTPIMQQEITTIYTSDNGGKEGSSGSSGCYEPTIL